MAADGIVLVQLLNSIKENCIPKYNKTPKSGKPLAIFKKRENLQMFLRTCRKSFQLRDGQLFEAGDLESGRNTSSFIACLQCLKKASPKPGPQLKTGNETRPKTVTNATAIKETPSAAPATTTTIAATPSTSISATTTSTPSTQETKETAPTTSPIDTHARTSTVLPDGWAKHHDPNYDRHYYFNDQTENTMWTHPEGKFQKATL